MCTHPSSEFNPIQLNHCLSFHREHRLKLYNLTYGLNHIRARAITLGSTGSWTEVSLTVVPPPPEGGAAHWGSWLISMAMGSALVVFFVGVWAMFTRNWAKQRQLAERAAGANATEQDLEMSSIRVDMAAKPDVDVELVEKRPHLQRVDSTDTLMSTLSDIDTEPGPPLTTAVAAMVVSSSEPAVAIAADEQSVLLVCEKPEVKLDTDAGSAAVAFKRAVASVVHAVGRPRSDDKKRLISCDDADELEELMSQMDVSLGAEEIDGDDAGAVALPPAVLPGDPVALPPAAAVSTGPIGIRDPRPSSNPADFTMDIE